MCPSGEQNNIFRQWLHFQCACNILHFFLFSIRRLFFGFTNRNRKRYSFHSFTLRCAQSLDWSINGIQIGIWNAVFLSFESANRRSPPQFGVWAKQLLAELQPTEYPLREDKCTWRSSQPASNAAFLPTSLSRPAFGLNAQHTTPRFSALLSIQNRSLTIIITFAPLSSPRLSPSASEFTNCGQLNLPHTQLNRKQWAERQTQWRIKSNFAFIRKHRERPSFTTKICLAMQKSVLYLVLSLRLASAIAFDERTEKLDSAFPIEKTWSRRRLVFDFLSQRQILRDFLLRSNRCDSVSVF